MITMRTALDSIRHPYLVIAMRLLLGVLLIWAGTVKAMDLELTARSMMNYDLVPEPAVNILALLLPAVELIVGACLILGLFMDGALLMATVLYGVFWLAVVSALARGLDIDCGCFGEGSSTVGMITLLRNTGFLLALVPLWCGDRLWLTIDACRKRTPAETSAEAN